jgi:hypothetical protein
MILSSGVGDTNKDPLKLQAEIKLPSINNKHAVHLHAVTIPLFPTLIPGEPAQPTLGTSSSANFFNNGKKQGGGSSFSFSCVANVTNCNDTSVAMHDGKKLALMTHLTKLNVLTNTLAQAQSLLDDQRSLAAREFLQAILPAAEHLRLFELNIAKRESKQMSIEEQLSVLEQQCWKRMVNERQLMQEEETCRRMVRVYAMWRGERQEQDKKERSKKIVNETARKYREWVKQRGKLLDDDHLDRPTKILEWACYSCKVRIISRIKLKKQKNAV